MTRPVIKNELYNSLEIIGEGLNSWVYKGKRKAHKYLPEQVVALKVFKNAPEVREFEKRFQDLAKVRSRYCLGLLYWEKLSDHVTIVMDYIEGVSLLELCQENKLEPSIQTEVLAQLKCGLLDLHEQGSIHGDLSASNILIDEAGQLKLIDYGFGQAEAMSSLVGTPQFMSLERWRGGLPTTQDDYFSYGLIAHDLKTGTISEKKTHREYLKRAESIYLDSQEHEIRACFHPEKEFRKLPQNLVESDSAKLKLASLVRRLRAQRRQSSKEFTKVLFTRSSWSRLWASVAASAIVVLSPQYSAGIKTVSRLDLKPAILEVRSYQWMKIKIDGLIDEYAPFSNRSIKPGHYTLYWKGANGSGKFKIKVESGKHYTLTDMDFRNSK